MFEPQQQREVNPAESPSRCGWTQLKRVASGWVLWGMSWNPADPRDPGLRNKRVRKMNKLSQTHLILEQYFYTAIYSTFIIHLTYSNTSDLWLLSCIDIFSLWCGGGITIISILFCMTSFLTTCLFFESGIVQIFSFIRKRDNNDQFVD